MTVDTTADRGRPIVTYVRVGRGMVKVTKYENEQPKSPSETASLRSRSSSGRSNPTPGPSRNWLRRTRTRAVPNKRAPSAHRSRSRSSGHSLQTVRRAGGYMHSDVDLPSAERRSSHDGTISPSRRAEPQGLFALNSLPVPVGRGDPAYNRRQPSSPQSEPRGRERRISRLSISSTHTHQSESGSPPSPSTRSWTTDSEIDPAASSEMWSSISRLEDELVSRFGRGVVPPLTALRQEKNLAPPQASTSRIRAPSLPDELAATPQRQPLHTQSQNAKLAQRFHEPITPRQVHRTKSTPTLAFPLPPQTFPDWVTHAPLPTPPGPQQGFPPSSPFLRAKIGPPPPFAPPPNFPPPPPPTVRHEDRDTKKDLEALVALYEVLETGYRYGTVGTTNHRPSVGRSGGLRKPGEAHDSYANGPRRKVSSAPKPFAGLGEDVLEEEEADVIPSGIVAHAY